MRLATLLNPIGYAREAQLAHALRSLPLFKELPASDLVELWRHLDRVRAEAGAIIFRRGDPGDRFYIVESGKLDVCLGVDEDGLPIRTLTPGDAFGEMALLTGAPRSADIVAVEESVLWVLERADFLRITGQSMPLLQAINRDLCTRIALMTLQIEDLEQRLGQRGAGVAGMRLGPYRVVQQIGSGGMAVVFSAIHRDTKEAAAVKVLPAVWMETEDFRRRLAREAEVLQRLNHPNVVRVLDVGEMDSHTGGSLYVAMEWLPHALDRVLRAQYPEPLPVHTALGIARQVAEGLAAVHELGVVHREVKPANILLRADGTPVLTDFGLVTAGASVAHQQRLTATNVVVGTADYMSPEQVRGDEVDGRSDLYSLGIVLYELLVGHVPFAGSEPYQSLHAHVYAPPPPLPDTVHPVAAAVVEQALQKAPAERFRNAAAMAEALAGALATVQPVYSPELRRQAHG
ncbi:MAG TPA: protein kinase [Chloroflexota bacterium]|nr:protein kinase [Chloroflexota bacterium]